MIKTLVEHIIESVNSGNISGCCKYHWFTGTGYLYGRGDETWHVIFDKKGFFKRKKVVKLFRNSYLIPITEIEANQLWELQVYFDGIIEIHNALSEQKRSFMVEQLRNWH